MLRAVVGPDGQQQILPQVPRFCIEHLDLQSLPTEVALAHAIAVREQRSHRVMDPSCRPLFDVLATHLPGDLVRLHLGLDGLLADAQSIDLLVHDTLCAYLHQSLAPTAPALSFRDYVLWTEQARASERGQQDWAYWLRRLEELPPGPQLPLAVQPESLGSPRFRRLQGSLDSHLWALLKHQASRCGLTPSGLLLAAFAQVLGCWSSSPRFTLSLSFFNRPPIHPDIKRLVGNYTSLVLVEVDSQQGLSFLSRAQLVQERFQEAIRHSLVSGIEVLRERSRTQRGSVTLMPVVFTCALGPNESQPPPSPPGVELVDRPCEISQTSQVWLDHHVFESQGTLGFHWDIADGLFPRGNIEVMFATYQQFLMNLAQTPALWQQPDLVLTPNEQLARFALCNSTHGPVAPLLLHQLFELQASRHPQAEAVVDSHVRLSYGDLLALARRLGRYLRQRGVQRDELVAVSMQKGWEQVLAVLGILFAGGAYLPIAAELPVSRKHELLQRGHVRLVLTQSQYALAPWPRELEVVVVSLDPTLAWMSHSDAPLESVQAPTDLAYVIFTSGSTGQPKGVAIEHRSAVNTITDINERFGLSPTDRILGISSLSFDLSVWDIFGTLAVGATLVLPEPQPQPDPHSWALWLSREAITIWNSVPALMSLVLEYGSALPPSLRLVLLSGDWIPVSLPGKLRTVLPDLQLISLGGATEAAIWSVLYPIDKVDPSWVSIPYGLPMRNQSIHVLDHTLAPCPEYVTGELYLGGQGLARGYFGDPERTGERFLVNPRTGERLYRTGDLGRWLPDGHVEFLGRDDHQVKIGGHRIELGEIEWHLSQHPWVQKSVVDARGRRDNRHLIAYVVLRAAPSTSHGGAASDGPLPSATQRSASLDPPTSPALLRWLLQRLPSYMVPSSLVLLEHLPLTHNGKIDRGALPDPAHPQETTAYAAPRDQLELQLTQIFEDVLGIYPVGIRDNFFAAGGTSLLAVRILTAIQQKLGHRLPLTMLFQEPTVEALAQRLNNLGTARPQSELVKIQPAGSRPPLFCAHAGSGDVTYFAALARHLGSEQPFYAFQARGFDEGQTPHRSIEEMASAYCEQMRRIQPVGPYYLSGHCLGGLLIFEMAHQLKRAGQQVALLAMISSPAVIPDFQADESGWLRSLARDLALLPENEMLKDYSENEQMDFVIRLIKQADYMPPWYGAAEVERWVRVHKACRQAGQRYVPRPLDEPLMLFRTKTPLLAEDAPEEHKRTYGWHSLSCQPVHICELPGTHATLFQEPHIGVLAEELKRVLAR